MNAANLDQSEPPQLFVFSGKSQSALDEAIRNAGERFLLRSDASLAELAHEAQLAAGNFSHRAFAICADRQDFEANVVQERCAADRSILSGNSPVVCLLFSGMGEQYAAMARELYFAFPVFRKWIDRGCAQLETSKGVNLKPVLLSAPDGPAHSQHEGSFRSIWSQKAVNGNDSGGDAVHPVIAHPALFVLEFALFQLLTSMGIAPRALLGHSLGEYLAACSSGVFSFEDALDLIEARARLMDQMPRGLMLAVQSSEQELRRYLRPGVSIAARNSPTSTVLSGSTGDIEQVEEHLRNTGAVCRRLNVASPFHSELMRECAPLVRSLFSDIRIGVPRIPFISGVTGSWITEEQVRDPEYWVQQMCRPVQFMAGLETILGMDKQVLVEIGAGNALTTFVRQQPGFRPETVVDVIPLMMPRWYSQSQLKVLAVAFGRLWLAGVDLNWTALWPQLSTRLS